MQRREGQRAEMQKRGRRRRIQYMAFHMLAAALLAASMCSVPAYASGAAAIVKNGFNIIYDIIAAVVSAIGALYLLWGVFEWAQSMNTQDGGAQSMAFKRIGAGVVACITPQIIPIMLGGMGS